MKRAALAEVNTTQSTPTRRSHAASSASQSVGASWRLTAYSTTRAPVSRSRRDRLPACSRERVTSTVRPDSGRLSNQRIASRWRTTSPITVIAGAPMPAACARAAIDARVPSTTRCCGSVPHWITATGVSTGLPFATSAAQISASLCMPMYSTSVSILASAAQSSCASLPGRSCPVQNATADDAARCVTGMPAYAGTAMPLVTPGTISNGTWCAASAIASSPPRPNRNGSPPLSRTTRRWLRASSISRRLISSCVTEVSCPRLPTKWRSACSGASASSSGFTR